MALVKAKSKKRSKRNEEQYEPPTLERVAVEDVQVIAGKHREVEPKKVESLAASIRLSISVSVAPLIPQFPSSTVAGCSR